MESLSIQSFLEMVAASMLVDDDDASCECMSLGMSVRERDDFIGDHMVRYFHSAPPGDLDAVKSYVRLKMRRLVISKWRSSHHRN